MTPEQVIKHFGNQAAAGRAIGVGRATVNYWKKQKRIHPLRQLHIEKITGGKLKAQ